MFEYFFAKRLYGELNSRNKVSVPAVRVAVFGMFVGLAVIIISVGVVVGFKHEVRNKVTGFCSDINVTSFNYSDSYETDPIVVSDSLVKVLYSVPGVEHVQRFSTKPGMVKTGDQFQGMVLKGVGADYDMAFISDHLVEGHVPDWGTQRANDSVVVSQVMADKLGLKLGDKVYTYFVNEEIRARRFVVGGIYRTYFSDYDNLFVIADIRTVNRLNGWEDGQVGGAEVKVTEGADIESVSDNLFRRLAYATDDYGRTYFVQTVYDLNPSIFSWLELLDMNVWAIFIIMLCVAGFSMVSGLLIIILERTNMIGILKALGAPDRSVRKIFIFFSMFLISRGMLWGNVVGIGLCVLQSWLHVVKLDSSAYYVDYVPVELSVPVILAVNVAVFVISVLFLVGPSYIIARIRPADSMKYD